MKPKPLAAAISVVGLLLAIMWWRQSSLEDEIRSLRESLAAEEQGLPPVAAAAPAPAESAPPPSSPREPFTPRVEVMGNTDDRITDLERVVNGQADVLEGVLDRIAKQDEIERKAKARAWGPEQVIGAPDTMTAGDQRTAWAPAAADGGMQWIQAEFASDVDIAKVIVRQTCNPGCITKVSMITETGGEVPIWEGQDPSKGQALADTPFTPAGSMVGRKVKIYLDTSLMPGWEEIDAVQLVGRDGSAQWAQSVNASSTYAGGQLGSDRGLERLWLDGADGGATSLGDLYRNSRPTVWSAQTGSLVPTGKMERRTHEN